jgi:hypothetical protein
LRNRNQAWLWAVLLLAGASEVQTYTYDGLGRLKQVDHSGAVNAGLRSVYTYDDADNRTALAVSVVAGAARPAGAPSAPQAADPAQPPRARPSAAAPYASEPAAQPQRTEPDRAPW